MGNASLGAFTGYADDNTVTNNLQETIENFCQWFSANAGKCHLLASSETAADLHISDARDSNKKWVKLLGINLERRLNFDFPLDKVIKKTSKNCHALSNYMDSNKKLVLMNGFVKSQFSYYLFGWMFHSSNLNNKINRLHEKALRLV